MNPIDHLANILGMDVQTIRNAAIAIREARKTEAFLEKIRIIRSGNTAITQSGEIVDRSERPDAMPYNSSHSES